VGTVMQNQPAEQARSMTLSRYVRVISNSIGSYASTALLIEGS